MSLDLWLEIDKPIKRKGTGIFVRKDGASVECKNIEEVKEFFPDVDISSINERETESTTVWSGNITHNLGRMASEIKLSNCNPPNMYELLWRGNEFEIKTAREVLNILVDNEVLWKLDEQKDYLKQYESIISPDDGSAPYIWGSYDNLYKFVSDLQFYSGMYPFAKVHWDR